MKNFFLKINKKMNGMIFTLIFTGVILLILSVLIVWTDFMLRLVVGLIIICIAYVFFYGAYKVWAFKKDIDNFLRFLK